MSFDGIAEPLAGVSAPLFTGAGGTFTEALPLDSALTAPLPNFQDPAANGFKPTMRDQAAASDSPDAGNFGLEALGAGGLLLGGLGAAGVYRMLRARAASAEKAGTTSAGAGPGHPAPGTAAGAAAQTPMTRAEHATSVQKALAAERQARLHGDGAAQEAARGNTATAITKALPHMTPAERVHAEAYLGAHANNEAGKTAVHGMRLGKAFK